MEITLRSISRYLPSRRVSADEMDDMLGVEEGWSLKATGVKQRFYSEGETTAQMGARALTQALHAAGMQATDLDLLVGVSGTTQQPIPCTAALLAAELGLRDSFCAFDVNATCLGFLVGLDLIASQMHLGRYSTAALVASEIASVGLNLDQKESAALFGDGSVAVILDNKSGQGIKILGTRFETFPEGASYCQIQGGSTGLHAKFFSDDNKDAYFFDMNGSKLFKLVAQRMVGFLQPLFERTGLTMDDIDLVIPHQASLSALTLLRRRLGLTEERFFINVQEQGNLIAASIPFALHDAIVQGRVRKGDKILLLGSSAGVSLGGVIIEY
ncbi:MAG: beta-ketoacyl-ACP synthase III [Chlamydiia bacterium]|nr:beta-ketoacyl-ACP synthase III [Chlamydiia bacterium]